MLVRMWGNWNSHTLLMGVENSAPCWKTVSYKVKHTPPMWHASLLLGIYAGEWKCTSVQNLFYMKVH